jgi:hypothetical protein
MSHFDSLPSGLRSGESFGHRAGCSDVCVMRIKNSISDHDIKYCSTVRFTELRFENNIALARTFFE